MKKIYIFDTTLRDGEQSPGASLNITEKIEIARNLKKLNVDIIEAGFPISSKGDFDSVTEVAKNIKGVTIAGLARAVKKDIDYCYEALKHSKKPRIHTFIATSDIHLKYKLKKTKDQVLDNAVSAVKYAKKYVDDVEFSAEDAVRTNIDFLCKVVESVIAAGAKTVNIPDTVGYSVPFEFGNIIKHLFENVKNINKAIISVHCHNDLGLATANSIFALQNGARQVECTINGLGERAGNASLEEIIMAIKTRKDLLDFSNRINTKEIYKTSKLVSRLTGIGIQPNKAIVGSNAFAHEAGIHQHGMMCDSSTYEIMTPESIGLEESELVLGKHSGRHAFKKKLESLGFKVNTQKIEKLFKKFKDLADKKKNVYDEDLETLVEEEVVALKETFKLKYFSVTSGNNTIPTATVELIKSKDKKKEIIIQEAACGDGPIDAVCKAVDRIIGIDCKLINYSLKGISGGKDAIGDVIVRVRYNDKLFNGRGASTDIVEASLKAYLNALNRILAKK